MTYLFHTEKIDYDFFKVSNTSITILFLHGWGGNKNSFTKTFPYIKQKYNILSITLPTISPTNLTWQYDDYINLILTILHVHNIKNLIIVCHSFGFRLACLLNQKITIKKLVVTGGAGIKKSTPILNINNSNNLCLLKQKRFKFLYKEIASKDYFSLSNTNKNTFKNVVNINTKNCLNFNCPILIFWGKNDTETPYKFAKKIAKSNHSKIIKTDGDHFTYLTHNSYFNNVVKEFLC